MANAPDSAKATTATPLRTFLDNLSDRELIERLQLALEGSGLGIWDWDPRDNSVQFDRRWCEMLGLDHASIEMELATWESRVHPDDLASCYADIQAHVEGNTDRYENVHRMRHADGHWVYILDRGRIALRDAEGNPCRFTGTHLDVTATEMAKRVLEDQTWILREFVQHVPAPVAMFDRDLERLATSHRWPALLLEEADDVSEAVRGRWRELCERGLAGETVVIAEDRIELAGGNVVWWSWEVHPWHALDGSIDGVLVTADDVTETLHQRAAEAQESRMAALGRMAGGLAHEINTPLQTLDLEAQSILDELEAESPALDEVAESAQAVAETVTRLSDVVRAMRTLARDAGGDAPEPVCAKNILDDVATLSRQRMMAHGVTFAATSEAADATTIRAHASDVGQVLLNLLHNAADATRSQRDGRVTLTLTATDDSIAFHCRDNGPGVPAELRERIMQPFFTTKPVGQGTGLGLSVSRALARKNGGSLELVETATGATFALTFPRRPEDATDE